MRVLLTNDDGYTSEGLHAIRKILENDHELWIVAPAHEQSGKSHSITVHTALHIQQVSGTKYQVYGSPADCVRVAVAYLMKNDQPDIIISGINKGENIGSDIIFSGTAGAARQGAYMGIPSLALSVFDDKSGYYYFESLAEFAYEHLELLRSLWNKDHFININAPNKPLKNPASVITFPCWRPYKEVSYVLKHPKVSDSKPDVISIFLDGIAQDIHAESGSDFHAIQEGKISISPIHLHPKQHNPESYYSAPFLPQNNT